jgi:hypothetical protein
VNGIFITEVSMRASSLVDAHDIFAFRHIVHVLASHPGTAMDRLEAIRPRWRDLPEDLVPDDDRFAFRHLSLAVERPFPKGMSRDAALPWAAHLCQRLVEFAERIELRITDSRPPLHSGVRIRSTPKARGA